jgi:hypothetical protein
MVRCGSFSDVTRCVDLILECQKLVELISAVQTSKDTLDRSRAFAEACGKGILSLGYVLLCLMVPLRGGYIAGRAWLRVERIAHAIYQ